MLDNNSKLESNWDQIVIFDEAALPGKSIFDIIKIILKVIEFRFVIIDDINGALVSNLLEIENKIIDLNNLLEIIISVKQLDWGDFFLFREYPQSWINYKKEKYFNIIGQTDTTVRAVDDTYIYVYTPYKKITNLIKENYKIESIKTDSLEKLDYPS